MRWPVPHAPAVHMQRYRSETGGDMASSAHNLVRMTECKLMCKQQMP